MQEMQRVRSWGRIRLSARSVYVMLPCGPDRRPAVGVAQSSLDDRRLKVGEPRLRRKTTELLDGKRPEPRPL